MFLCVAIAIALLQQRSCFAESPTFVPLPDPDPVSGPTHGVADVSEPTAPVEIGPEVSNEPEVVMLKTIPMGKRPMPIEPVDYWVDTTTTEKPVFMPGTHSIIAAKSIRPGSTYAVSVELHKVKLHKALEDEFKLDISIVDGSQTKVATLTTSVMKFTGIKVFNVEIPTQLSDSTYTLKVDATGGIIFSYSKSLTVNTKHLSLFIQTDKVLYQPGQTVLFRVVAIDPLLRPIVGPIDITITDNFGNRILQATRQNNSGVVTDSLELSDQTPLGTWQIKATTQGISATKTFEVAEYVLPKFEVTVDLPKYFLVNINNPSQQKDLVATISAIYTYGKPVEGSATVSIKLQYFWGVTPTMDKNLQLVDGKAQIVLTTKDLNGILPSGWRLDYSPQFLFTANVVEDATGLVLSGNNTVACTTEKYNLKFLDLSPNNFKPGLIYTAFIQLSRNDGSPPSLQDVTDRSGKFLDVEITAECNFAWTATDVLQQTPIRNVFLVPTTESGYASFTFNVSAKVDNCALTAKFYIAETNTSATAYKSIETFKTRDSQNIQVLFLNPEGTIKPKTIAHFSIKSNKDLTSFSYYILGKGKVFESKTVTGAASTQHDLDFEVTEEIALELAPELTIIVTLLTADNELVADSITVTIVDYFTNKVSLAFNTNSTLPGKDVVLNVNAHPGSFVGLLAVDQSVLLLASGNDITKTIIMDDIKQYSQSTFMPNWIDRPIPFVMDKRKKKKVPTATLR